MTFGELFRRAGHDVSFASRAGVMLSEHFSLLDDEVVTKFPDVVIVNHGIIEIYPRRTIRALNNATIRNYYLNHAFNTPYRFQRPGGSIWLLLLRAGNALVRRTAQVLGLRWQWQSRRRFLEVMDACCSRILKETGAFVVVMGIPPPSVLALLDSPGFARNTREVNDALRSYCSRLPGRLAFADVEAMLADAAPEVGIPDGIHFSAAGHRLVHAGLCQVLGGAGHEAC
jgi:hypothetical protein